MEELKNYTDTPKLKAFAGDTLENSLPPFLI
jgi:hypothetical protein